MASTRVLTGITTSGTPHIGNYVGAIRPAVAASRQAGVESFYFLADYHALIKAQEPARVQRSTLEIAAAWLACGLDPDKVWFYRQSDIPEIPELTWLLSCVAGKGLLNRAHAYKAATDKNLAAGEDEDAGVTAGLFMYPVLMAADILMFGSHKVPVGRDQIQHIEMARDFAARFNHLYGELLVLPEAVIEEQVATLPGLDGRKMSKSYDNTIPLFAPRDQLKKLVFSILTDSRAPGEPKDPEASHLFQIYAAFAAPMQAAAFAESLRAGMSWGEAKRELFELMDAELSPMREKYEALIARPADIEALLLQGARKARELSVPLMRAARQAVGLRPLQASANEESEVSTQRAALPQIKQFRDADGFRFKIVDGKGVVLFQSRAFSDPKQCGGWIADLRRHGAERLSALHELSEVGAGEVPGLAEALQALQQPNDD